MSKKILGPDKNRLCWNDYFMAIAKLVSLRSPDNHKVGSVLVAKDNKIISTGYNSTPKGIKPEKVPWGREDKDPLKTKYPFVLHSEVSAILCANEDLSGTMLFATLYPCCECAKMIIQKDIKKIWYLENPYKNTPSVKAAAKMFKLAGVKTEQFKSKTKEIIISLEC